ncbi:MAG: gamma-glutamyltransferase family protein [Acidimicrobiales bacterium]
MKRILFTIVVIAALLGAIPADASSFAEQDGIGVTSRNTGDLIIEGTNGDDSAIYLVAGASAGDVSVRIGGSEAANEVFAGPVRNVTVQMKGGADSLNVHAVTLPGNLVVNGGGDGDHVRVTAATVAGLTNLQMGSTTDGAFDLVNLKGSEFGAAVTIGGTSGFNGVVVDGIAVAGNLNIATDGGASLVSIDNSTLLGFRFSGGRDGDSISVHNSDLGSDPTILTRGGNDTIAVNSSSYTGTATIDSDSGDDFIDYSPTGSESVTLNLRTGSGDDIVEALIGSEASWGFGSIANGGPGTDSFEGQADGATVAGFETVDSPGGEARREMVVTANPAATDAAALVLRQGGSAVDAMVAAQSMLGLVEPQSSGIGGGAFVVYYDAATGETTTFDAREKAPAAALETRFEGLGFFAAWQSGLSVGVPGVPRLMEDMQARYGRLPLAQSLTPATATAISGFELTGRTSDQVAGLLARNDSCEDRLFFADPAAFSYFANPDCTAKPAGTAVTNVAYGETLAAIGEHGADGFYTGSVAENIAAAVQGDPRIAGDMTTDDLANYQTVERDPVCVNYRGHDVCGMGPPSSGGLTVGQILGILQSYDLGSDPLDEETVHLVTQASKLAFADRNFYIGDSDFVSVPTAGLLDTEYLASRAALITGVDMGTAAPGVPPGASGEAAADTSDFGNGTSHLVVVDQWGNALSMTTSIESSFGNGVMVDGFLLNNELTDFSFRPTDDEGNPIANRVQPGKRPRSSMSPTIVLDAEGDVKLLTGSPGGSRIIGYTAQSIMNVLDFGLTPQESVMVPHYLNRNGSTNLETPIPGVTNDYDAEALKAQLEARGQTVSIRALTSGLSMILADGDDLLGGADLRRDGTVGGRGR